MSPVFQNHHHPPILGCLLATSTSHWVSVLLPTQLPFSPGPSLSAEGLEGRGGESRPDCLCNGAKFYKHTYSWAKADPGSAASYLHLEIPPLIINLSVTFKHGPVGDEWVWLKHLIGDGVVFLPLPLSLPQPSVALLLACGN